MATCVLTSSLFLAGCGAQESASSATAASSEQKDCATASALKPGKNPSLFFYNTMTRDEMYLLDDGTVSNYGLELSEEVKKSWDPLNGTGLSKRRTCTQAFVLEGSKKVYLEKARVPGSHLVSSLRLQKGYIMLSGEIGEGSSKQAELVQLNVTTGLRKQYALEPRPANGCYAFIASHPSPSGDFIVTERLQPSSCGFEEPSWEVTLKLFDSLGQTLGDPAIGTFTGGSQITWVSEAEYEIKDNERTVRYSVPSL